MDWLEEKIEYINKKINNKSFMKSIICYMLLGALAAIVLYYFTRCITSSWGAVVQERHKEFYLIDFQTLGEIENISFSEKLGITTLTLIHNYSLYVYILVAQIISIRLFYIQKIYPAYNAMEEAMNYMFIGDYSHEISYSAEDEVGILCKKTDAIRKMLIEQKLRQWNIDDEQRKINAAFAHDIRTPLTVIKGYAEFLEKYLPQGKVSQEAILEKIIIIKQQEERLFEFSKTMTSIHNMEEREIKCNWRLSKAIDEIIEHNIKGIAQNAKEIDIIYNSKLKSKELFVDEALILEVLDNIIGNSLRYVKHRICVDLCEEGTFLNLIVTDDGEGFSDKAIRNASDMYYSEESESMEHFGLGLSICKILCEKHGGDISYQNSIESGAIVIASFRIRMLE